MPELPEVETIKRGLEKRIVGRIIKRVEVLNLKSVQFDSRKVEGKKILKIWRRAKMLGIDLSENLSLLCHLKMTGQLVFVERGGERIMGGHPTENMVGKMPNRDTRSIFYFSDGSTLYFNDQIKFGWIKLIETSNLDRQAELSKLGPEPLSENFTWMVLKDVLIRRKKTPVKVALMDQSLIAGIGNIYASEALFLAKIDPRRAVGSLSDGEFRGLEKGIKKSLEESIKLGGSTIRNYVDAGGRGGEYIASANVYGKEGQLCKECKGKITRTTQAGRGTFFCPNCQK